MEQREARLDPRQRRPLAGCRLSRTPVTVDPSFLWPWPPSLPDSRRFGPPFGGLPVLRGHPTSPVPSSPRSFVLDDYRREPPAGGQEISPGKKRRTSCEPVAFTRARRNGDRASALPAASTPRSHASSAFRLCSVPHCTVGLPSDPSSRMRPCLWWRVPSVQGPGRTSISSCRSSRHLLFCVHAGRTGLLPPISGGGREGGSAAGSAATSSPARALAAAPAARSDTRTASRTRSPRTPRSARWAPAGWRASPTRASRPSPARRPGAR